MFGLVAAMLLAACGKPDDAVSQAAKKDAANAVPSPSVAEVKAIAEEGFVYGLPIVMNYGVMYEYIIDNATWYWDEPEKHVNA